MELHTVRRGSGKPLLLVHGIGGSWRSWDLVLPKLAQGDREVIAVDLPGHGATPPLDGEASIRSFADALAAYLMEHSLLGIDAVGSSMGARLVLELARRGGILGAVVALDPGGFWQGWEIPVFFHSISGSVRVVRALEPILPVLTALPIGRTALFAQFSPQPWALPARLAYRELRSLADSPSFDELLDNLAHGEAQQGSPEGSIAHPLTIGWGENDLVCLPRQADRAVEKFPDAQLFWFPNCGHFPQWDRPELTARLILAATAGRPLPQATRLPAPQGGNRTRWATAAALAAVTGVVLFLQSRR